MRPSKISLDSICLQTRDLAVLQGLFESRVMTATHIATLYFDGKQEATKKRLQKLKAAGLIGERTRRAYEPAILNLGRKAFAVLHDAGVLTKYPSLNPVALERRTRLSSLTLRHELEIMDVKAAFDAHIRKTGTFSIDTFCTWPLLYEFEAFRENSGVEVTVKPDGFIRIHEKENDGGLSEHAFFLEVDRSSETHDKLVTRTGCYIDYYKSGGFAYRNGAPRSEFKNFPFRVLMVFKTAERRNNIAERLLQNNPPIFSQVCLSTFEEVTRDPLGKVWIRPLDYHEATKGTPFNVERRRETWEYRRKVERELLVEQTIKRSSLLSP